MASIHLTKLITPLLIAMSGTVAAAAGNVLLTAEQRHMALCVQTIAHDYFSHGRSTVVSMPQGLRNNSRRPLIHFPYTDDLQLVDLVLQHVNDDTCCPLQMLPAETELNTVAEINHSYIIFIWREQGDEDIIAILDSQLRVLKDSEALQWNPRGRFLVVVTDEDSSSIPSVALKIYEIMWTEYNIVDSIVLNPDSSGNRTVLNLYTGFPYQKENCKNVKEVTLLDQWVLENNGKFSNKSNLFPSKIPNNFHNCAIKVATIGFHPFVSLINKDMTEDGSTVYEVRGVTLEYFLLSMKKMNMTVLFLPPSLDVSSESAMAEAIKLSTGMADVVVGIIPLSPVFFSGLTEPSIPYISDAFKWFVPCPRPISRIEKIVNVFDASIWLMMITVFILTSALFWCLANYPDRMVEKESKNMQTIQKSTYSVWTIFIGVSVPEMPRTWNLRIFFLIYVCYCFAMSTVFQAFFVSYLIEPGYEKKIETFQELLDSNVNYGYNSVLEFGMQTMDFRDHLKFPPTRRINCADLKTCIMRMMSHGDVATISAPGYAKYLANELGHHGEMKSPCSLDENFIYGSLVALFTNGNPLLKRLNTLIRRCLEGRLVERYWAQLNHEALLKSNTTYDQEGSSMYFVFTLSHMRPVFSVLAFGYVCSTIAYLAECLHKRFSK
ncbi:hypothetical protein Cfor_06393 [Coptotermes formosanus]|uniref:Ionotropic glutamate receptor C-terminal domain-containing protein n=1 Tax=Coptotermes formosanus TaxID=36987 RepID=A0A6L2Q191_COPFO|nr:hypothetical protein Cfor_06393 [Coptotermes formosanus]